MTIKFKELTFTEKYYTVDDVIELIKLTESWTRNGYYINMKKNNNKQKKLCDVNRCPLCNM